MASCSSSVSLQKSIKSEDQRSKSCDTVCTSNSSCILQKRKPMNPLMYSLRPSYSKTSTNAVRQRVLSAKLLKLRSIQNQLNDANYHLSELTKENQILKNLQKRQDKALSKYENTNADLPRLIRSHEEQLRILTEKNKIQRRTIKELNEIIKIKEEELIKTQEKLNHLEKLNKDKRLLDKEKLLDQIEDLKLKLQKSDEQVAVLNRKLMLESKLSKQRLNAELVKYKQCQRELVQAQVDIDRLTHLLELKENTVHPRKNRLSRSNQRQSISMVHLNRTRSSDKSSSSGHNEESHSKTPVTDIKLQPIKNKVEEAHSDILNVPSVNVKNRLSSASLRSKSSDENIRSGSGSSINNQDIPDETSLHDLENDVEEFEKNLDYAIEQATENAHLAGAKLEEDIVEYYSEIMENVRHCNDRIEMQKESLRISTNDTNTLKETFEKTKQLESKLKKSLLKEDKDGMDFISELFSEDLKLNLKKDRNENVLKKGPRVKLEDRKKLLATLKAIDNGDSLDSLHENSTDMRKEIIDVTK